MADVTFDGVNKIIQVNTGITLLDMRDIYSAYKLWVTQGNSNFLQAISYIGADPIPNGQLGTTFFLENGWKIRPYEGNHTLVIKGNLYSRDGSDTVISTVGAYNVRVLNVVSTLVETVVANGVGTPEQVADAVWSAPITNHTIVGTFGHFLQKKVLTIAKYIGLK